MGLKAVRMCLWSPVATALHLLLGAEFFPRANLSAQQIAFQIHRGLSSGVILGLSWGRSGTPFLWGLPGTPFKYGNEHLKCKG